MEEEEHPGITGLNNMNTKAILTSCKIAETVRNGRQPVTNHPALTMAGYSFSHIEGGDYSIERR